jgi:hypothetical protein
VGYGARSAGAQKYFCGVTRLRLKGNFFQTPEIEIVPADTPFNARQLYFRPPLEATGCNAHFQYIPTGATGCKVFAKSAGAATAVETFDVSLRSGAEMTTSGFRG